MGDPVPAMVDVAFRLVGSSLPRDHRWALSQALAAEAPWLADEPGAGVHEINLAPGQDEQGWLSTHSRLMVRVPRDRAADMTALEGRRLQADGAAVVLGSATLRELLPHRTLYSHFVDARGTPDEGAFVEATAGELQALRVDAQAICGRAQRWRGPGGWLHGFSLMLHGLRAGDALRILEAGLGPHRLMGCGLFVPHKSAAAVGD